MKSKYKCEICKLIFDNIFLYIDHLSEYIKNDNISDKDKDYVRKSTMNIKRISDKCPICNINIGSYYYYLRHKITRCKKPNILLDKIKSDLVKCNKTELDDITKFIANLTPSNTNQTQNTTTTIVTESPKIEPLPQPPPPPSVDLSKNVTNLKVKDDPINEEETVVISKKVIIHNLRDPNVGMLSAENVDYSIVDIYEDLMENDRYDYSVTNLEKVLLSFYKTIYFNEEYPENHSIYVPNEGNIWTYENEWVNSGNLWVKLSEIVEDVKVATKEWMREVVKYRVKEHHEGLNTNQIKSKFERLQKLDHEIDYFPNDDQGILNKFYDIAYSFNSMVEKTYKTTSKPKIIRIPRTSRKNRTTLSS
jgi:hypothetical protein